MIGSIHLNNKPRIFFIKNADAVSWHHEPLKNAERRDTKAQNSINSREKQCEKIRIVLLRIVATKFFAFLLFILITSSTWTLEHFPLNAQYTFIFKNYTLGFKCCVFTLCCSDKLTATVEPFLPTPPARITLKIRVSDQTPHTTVATDIEFHSSISPKI